MIRIKEYFSRFSLFMSGRAFQAALFSAILALAVCKYADLTCAAAPAVDAVSYEETSDIGGEAEESSKEVNQDASSDKFFPVYVVDYGEKTKVLVKGGTVEDVLTQLEVVLSKHDIVDVPFDSIVSSGDVITVSRVRYNTVEIRKKLPYDTIARYSSELKPGTEKLLTEGEPGARVLTVRQTIVDGVVEEEEVKDSVVEIEPVDRQVLRGFPVKPVSSYDFGSAFDENCEPVEYVNVLRNQKSAGYTARSGASTASGMDAAVGHVAVNPKVIPYGAKLFIKSSDGTHIYGYAIAADTGTALMDGRIAVDLFYNTYKESADNGIREVDIFILEE